MMLTREQAAATWCPMVRMVKATERSTVEHGQPAFNRAELPGNATGVPSSCMCIADQCAMWRWIPGCQKNSAGARHPPTRGYCGLAGVPVVGGAA